MCSTTLGDGSEDSVIRANSQSSLKMAQSSVRCSVKYLGIPEASTEIPTALLVSRWNSEFVNHAAHSRPADNPLANPFWRLFLIIRGWRQTSRVASGPCIANWQAMQPFQNEELGITFEYNVLFGLVIMRFPLIIRRFPRARADAYAALRAGDHAVGPHAPRAGRDADRAFPLREGAGSNDIITIARTPTEMIV